MFGDAPIAQAFAFQLTNEVNLFLDQSGKMYLRSALVRPMQYLVARILFGCRPAQIGKLVILAVAVPMRRLVKARRWLPYKRAENEPRDVSVTAPFPVEEANSEVSVLIWTPHDDPGLG